MKIFLLTVLSFVTIILILNAGYYKVWFVEKPMQYWTDFLKEKDDTAGIEGRMTARFGLNYTICAKVKEYMTKKKIVNPVILFEPNSYYRDSLHIQVRVPEPAVFYYYTGLKGVWTTSAEVNKANYLVRISKKGVNLDQIRTPEQLQQILARYQKFTPIL
ncbi:MAG TPA: hypothetical protein VL832_01000 [Puia sp.]|jgi:hypothetical protein|nr:hypothetical protein [Puia sp.]